MKKPKRGPGPLQRKEIVERITQFLRNKELKAMIRREKAALKEMGKPKPFGALYARVVPQREQRYGTVGDYWFDGQGDHYRVSELSQVGYRVAVLVHEIVEWELCKLAGISEKDVTEFDLWFEREGLDGEPGAHVKAPYWVQHRAATDVEREVIKAFGLDWDEYEDECGRMVE